MSALGGTADTENELRVPLLAAQLLSIATPITGFACALYFWSRLAHVIVYTLGIPVLRTLAFAGRFAAQAGPASACDLQVELTASLLPLARTPTPKRKWRGQEPIKLPPPLSAAPQTIHYHSVDVAHGLVLLFELGRQGPSIMGFEARRCGAAGSAVFAR